MARKQVSQPPLPPPLVLLVPREEATQKITTQRDKGLALLQMTLNSMEDIEKLKAEKSKWVDYTSELLKRLFSNETLSREFEYVSYSTRMNPSPQEIIRSQHEQIKRRVTILESILDRLELIPELEPRSASATTTQPSTS